VMSLSPLIAGHFDTVPPTLLNYIVALYVSSSFIVVLGADALEAEPRDPLLEPTPRYLPPCNIFRGPVILADRNCIEDRVITSDRTGIARAIG
ncbi:MAG: hypothetical protein LC775_00240, partial [Acidobacteria bacterium]|nr:hypothetical protein [Acidobacteriota bacterium]